MNPRRNPVWRRVAYYASLRGEFLAHAVVWLLQRLLFWLCRTETVSYEGIVIADLGPRSRFSPRFLQKTVDALDLIRDKDPRRFARVRREIRYIVKAPSRSMATHNRICRTCRIDFERLDTVRDDAVVLARLARVIVHEATHGHLDLKYVAHSRRNRDRIEKICIVEEHRFMRLLEVSDDGWYGTVDEQVRGSVLAQASHQAMSLRAKVTFVRDRFR